MVLMEAPHGWLVGQVPSDVVDLLGGSHQFFIDLGIEDWPNAKAVSNAYQQAIATTGVSLPGRQFKLLSARAHELSVEPFDDSVALEMPDNWMAFVQLFDFHRADDTIMYFGKSVRNDRRSPDFDTGKGSFVDTGWGYRRTG